MILERKKKCRWVSVGEKRARPNRRDEGSGSSAQGMVLGVPQTRGSDFTIEHLEQGVFFFLHPIRFEQRMNLDRVRTAYIVPFTFTCNPLLAQINLNLKENRLL